LFGSGLVVEVEIGNLVEAVTDAGEAGKVAKMLRFSLTNESW